jgi:parallel beta-helix repeat protein
MTTWICGLPARGRIRGLAGVAMIFAASPASAATLIVSGGATPCPGATYATIQSAVDAAAPHDDLVVCPGTYAEQIVVPAGKDGLVIQASERLAAIIKAPATMADPGDIVRINVARDVTLTGFVVAGPLPSALFCSTFPRTGVRVDGGGSASIRGNRFTDIRSEDPDLRGCQNGIPVLVGSEPEGQTGSALIEQNTIDAYQKTGVVVDNAGSSAVIYGNLITGDGPNATIVQNGIQVSNGGDAFVGSNWVSGQVYTPSPEGAALLFSRSSRVSVVGNVLHEADFGIVTLDATAFEIRNNSVAFCTANGIDLDQLVTGTTGGLIVLNDSHDNGGDGIYVSASSKENTLRANRFFNDRAFDAEDDSVGQGSAWTANVWEDNHCKTDNKGGSLCEP